MANIEIAIITTIIGAGATVFSALIAGIVTWIISVQKIRHQKQWAYISKRSWLIDNAIEIVTRMMFNKLLITDHDDSVAHQNLFILQKEALVVESQMVVYADPEIVEAFSEIKELILSTNIQGFRKKWNEINQKGRDCLMVCRKHLGRDISDKFKDFEKRLTSELPAREESLVITASTNSMGSISLTSTLHEPKVITENNEK